MNYMGGKHRQGKKIAGFINKVIDEGAACVPRPQKPALWYMVGTNEAGEGDEGVRIYRMAKKTRSGSDC